MMFYDLLRVCIEGVGDIEFGRLEGVGVVCYWVDFEEFGNVYDM